MELEYILPIIIIIILVKQNSNFKSQIAKLTDGIDKLNNKLDKLSSKQTETPVLKKENSTTLTNQKPTTTLTEELFKSADKKQPQATSLGNNNNVDNSTLNKDFTKNNQQPETIFAPQKEPAFKRRIPKTKKPSLWKRFKEKNPDLEKFVGENLINKIGVLILVLGISYFVKYAIDKDWINEPARVAIGILAGSIVLGIAHKLRKKYASFGSVLVGGAVAIFYFTIAIAFHEYQLFNQTIAFVIMVLITAFSCLLSLSYNRIELAVLSLIGGFAVPFMISSGEGDFKILFSYILILNVGILAIAYFKRWSLVNTLAFIFTNVLFIGWIVTFSFSNKEVPYLGAFLFAFSFYLLFIITNIINNLRSKGEFTNSQLILLASNSFVFYGIGMFILTNFHPETTGLFTAGLALLNLAYASFLYKKFGLDKKAVYLLIGLTLTFITLAIPIQFKGNYITLFWAAEAVLLMWLTQKSKIKNYYFASVVVHILMLISLILDWQEIYGKNELLKIIINPICITGIVATASLYAVNYLLRKEDLNIEFLRLNFSSIAYKKYVAIAAPVILYIVGFLETTFQAIASFGETASSLSFIVIYHLLFTAILVYQLLKNKNIFNIKLLNIICVFNTILYILLIVELPFQELKETIISGENTSIAYLFHFVSLTLIIYFIWLLYKTNKENFVFNIYNKKAILWLLAGAVVYIASKELLIEGLIIGSPKITSEQIVEIQNIHGNEVELGYYEKSPTANKNINNLSNKLIKTALPVLWGILSFFFLIWGIKKQIKSLRIIALALLGLTIIKLFTYDISSVSETGKIIAFILLGILILIISFVYQKIKVLVIDEEEKKIDTNIE